MPTGILRFVYALNVIIPSTVGLIHLASPSLAADRLWDGLARPSLAMPMLGSVWLAVGFLSLLGLRSADPLRFSPVLLFQLVYKVFYLSVAIAPLALQGRWAEFPQVSTAVFAAYLPLLLVATPWAYLLGKEAAGARSKKME